MDTIFDTPIHIHMIALVILLILMILWWFLIYSPLMAEFREKVIAYKNKVLLNVFIKRDGMILATKEPSWLLSLMDAYNLV